MIDVLKSFFKVLMLEKSFLRFALGIIVGFAFSISVILATIGVMDGFEWSLKLGLKKSVGDISIYYRDTFFNFEKEMLAKLTKVPHQNLTAVLKTEAFAVSHQVSKGVIIKGIDLESYSEVTGTKILMNSREVAIGFELARFLKLKVGDEIVLAFSKGNDQLKQLPALESFTIGQIIEHGIYQKDMRFVYLNREHLQKILELENLSNEVIMTTINSDQINYLDEPGKYIEDINRSIDVVEYELGDDFYAKPFWSDFSFLLRAVSTEKYMIGIILQLVVVISIFNVLAFVIFINERRSRELFLFQALGMSQKRVFNNMMILILMAWILSCMLSIGFVEFFDFALREFPLFQLPGKIYTLGKISINLDLKDYFIVFALAFFWIFLMTYFGLSRIRKQSILTGLRREFA